MAPHGPKPPPPGLVFHPGVRVGRSDEHTLSWRVDDSLTVGQPESLPLLRQECLGAGHLRAIERVQFGQFHNPDTAELHRRILASHIGKLVREPIISCQNSAKRALSDSLRSLQDEDMVHLASRVHHPRDGGNEELFPYCPDVGVSTYFVRLDPAVVD